MSLDALCDTHILLVEKPLITQDSSGGSVRSWTTLFDSIPGNVQPLSYREKILFAQRQIMYTNRIYFASDYGITRDCRLTVLFPESTPQRVFVALGSADMAGQGRAFNLEVREQTTP